jgi:adenylate kinase family enzyme
MPLEVPRQLNGPHAQAGRRHHRVVRRVSIIGTSGAGKSTLGAGVADRLGVPYIELDGVFHQPGWTQLPPEEFQRRVEEVAAQPAWVIDGTYSTVRHLIWRRADCAVWLDLPRLLVTSRVLRRTVRRLATRQELWNGNRDRWRDLLSTDPRRSTVAAAWKRYPEARARCAGAVDDPQWRALSTVHLRSRRDVAAFLSDLDRPAHR